MNPIALLLMSGGATFLYDKYKEKKAAEGKNGASVGRMMAPPLKFSQQEALQFTAIRDGNRLFDKKVIDSPEIKKWLKFSCTEVIPNGPPGCQSFMVHPFGAFPTASAESVIRTACEAEATVVVTLSLIYIGAGTKAPIMICIGDESLSRLCHVSGDFALWPHSVLPAVKKVAMPQAEDGDAIETTAVVVGDSDKEDKDEESTDVKAHVNGTAKVEH